MMPTRLSPAASCATSEAACALPAAIMVPAAVLHAATLTICSCKNTQSFQFVGSASDHHEGKQWPLVMIQHALPSGEAER